MNSMHDSLHPARRTCSAVLMQLGEVVFGGVGSGLYGMLVFVVVAVFVAGLMVGRTPEYLGKKSRPFEMKMAALVILAMPLTVLLGTAVAVLTGGGRPRLQPGPARIQRGALRLLLRRQQQRLCVRWSQRQQPLLQHGARHRDALRPLRLAVPVLAIAGSLAAKKVSAAGRAHSPRIARCSWAGWCGGADRRRPDVLPALALGPIVEHLMLH